MDHYQEQNKREWWLLATPVVEGGREINTFLGWMPREYCLPYLGDTIEGQTEPELFRVLSLFGTNLQGQQKTNGGDQLVQKAAQRL